jgi:large subunit ribosomal protein L24
MKLRVGDPVLVMVGKDKGKKGQVTKVLPREQAVVVEGMNVYVKHMKPMGNQAGQRLQRSRPLATSKVAIINNEGKIDRIGYKLNKDGTKERIFKKTGKVIPTVEKVAKK